MSGSRSNMAQPQNWVLLVTELRRYPQMSYKSDMVVLSGEHLFAFLLLDHTQDFNIRYTFIARCKFKMNAFSTFLLIIPFPLISNLGLDTGDRKALDVHFKKDQCLMDTEDRRFVLKGPQFPPMEVSLIFVEGFYPIMLCYTCFSKLRSSTA